MKELIRVRVQYASRQQCCKTHKRPLPLPFYLLPLYWALLTGSLTHRTVQKQQNDRPNSCVGLVHKYRTHISSRFLTGVCYSSFIRSSGESNPRGDEIFHVFQTGHKFLPASCTMGTGSFLRIKPSELLADHPPHASARFRIVWTYSSSSPYLSRHVRWLTFTFH